MQMQRSKMTILVITLKLIDKYQRSYCFPTRRKYQILLKKFHGIDISLAAIDKHLKSLADLNYIKSYRRHGRREDGTCFNKPSNRQITKAGLSMLLKLGVYVSTWFKNLIFQGKGKRKRFQFKDQNQSLKNQNIERRPRFSEFSTIGDILKSAI